jgi:hypothetical protein
MFFLFNNRLGCAGSLVFSLVALVGIAGVVRTVGARRPSPPLARTTLGAGRRRKAVGEPGPPKGRDAIYIRPGSQTRLTAPGAR